MFDDRDDPFVRRAKGKSLQGETTALPSRTVEPPANLLPHATEAAYGVDGANRNVSVHDPLDVRVTLEQYDKEQLVALADRLASKENIDRSALLVNVVCPGWVRTDIGGQNAVRSVAKGVETPVWLARFESGSPSGYFWRDEARIER